MRWWDARSIIGIVVYTDARCKLLYSKFSKSSSRSRCLWNTDARSLSLSDLGAFRLFDRIAVSHKFRGPAVWKQGNRRHRISPRWCNLWFTSSIRLVHVAFAWPKIGKLDVIRKTGSTFCIAVFSDEDRVAATVNVYRTFVKFGRVVFEFWHMFADTYTPPPPGEARAVHDMG